MYELQDIYVEVVEKYTLDSSNTFSLMKHKHKGCIHIIDAITIFIM